MVCQADAKYGSIENIHIMRNCVKLQRSVELEVATSQFLFECVCFLFQIINFLYEI